MKPAPRDRKNQGVAPRSFLSDFFGDVDRFFDNDFMRMPAQFGRQLMGNMPATNIRENKDDFSIEVAAPGMTKDDFNIDLRDGMLTISCEKESDNKEEKENFTRREYNYSSFSRSFNLPDSVKEDDIKARYQDGILHISVPKGQEQEPPKKKIEIQ
jgi:HSP20 family protein